MKLVSEAIEAGARQAKACECVGISERTYRRWREQGEHGADKRPQASRPRPQNALSEEERERIVRVANEPHNASKAPACLVAELADEGRY
ncbi:MAG: transposase, partial [Verrucomicrobia bacterium]|nr:transposase [Verrucomicrobiota bacterium]